MVVIASLASNVAEHIHAMVQFHKHRPMHQREVFLISDSITQNVVLLGQQGVSV